MCAFKLKAQKTPILRRNLPDILLLFYLFPIRWSIMENLNVLIRFIKKKVTKKKEERYYCCLHFFFSTNNSLNIVSRHEVCHKLFHSSRI